MTASHPLRALLAEDNPTDALLLRKALEEANGLEFELTRVETLADCLACLDEQNFDIVLVDLGLPDSSGLDTFVALQRRAAHTPILVLTGLNDEETGLRAVQLGAQDYLVKGQLQSAMLGRLIRYAAERYQLQRELDLRRQRAEQDREVLSMTRLSESSGTPVTGSIYASPALRVSYPEEFAVLMNRYEQALERALEARVYKTPAVQGEALREMAQELGFLRAGPRDVVEIHSACFQRLIVEATPARTQAYLEEGRIAVLELMGNLVGYYRNYYSAQQKKGAAK
jgi:CheY-like chemotaxis protein